MAIHVPKVTELSDRQVQQLEEYRLRWLKIAFSSGPTDRREAEKAIRAMYACADLKEPRRIVWYPSPMALWLARCTNYNVKTYHAIGRSVDQNVWDQMLDLVEGQITPVVLEYVDKEILRLLEEPLINTAWARVAQQVRARVIDGLGDKGYHVKAAMLRSVERRFGGFGNMDAAELANIDYLRDVCGLKEETCLALGLIYVAMTAGWYLAFERECWVSEKPQFVRVDELNRLHSDLGPAIRYSDGFEVYAMKGVMVPDWLVTNPKRLTARQISDERNLEVRRIMLDTYGPEKYLRYIGAKPISIDDFGTLYQARFNDDEPLMMVKVINSTPEPDGSFKDYWIRVPPTIRTAREAVAWTFNMKPEDYLPGVQT